MAVNFDDIGAMQLLSGAADDAEMYEKTLIDNVMPFWEKHSVDHVNGGYFTCLDRKGTVFDKDKFVWLQGRQVYTFAKLAVKYKEKFPEKSKKWVEVATIGANFLKDKCQDKDGNFYFAVSHTGKPITQPFSIFSDCFAVIAFCWYYRATGLEWAKELSLKIFDHLEIRRKTPLLSYDKSVPGSRSLSPMNISMIDLNLCLEMEEAIPELKPKLVDRIKRNTDTLVKHIDPHKKVLREHYTENVEDRDTFEGRVVIPGHGLEGLWFMLAAAEQNKDTELINKCVEVTLATLKYGWDVKHGGLFYFMDIEGKPPQQLEWDQKLWWVHLEALITVALAFKLTKNAQLADWYLKLKLYIFSKFKDHEHPEFYGYLNRQGEVLLELKGGKWKGCFHVPRALYLLAQISREIAKLSQ